MVFVVFFYIPAAQTRCSTGLSLANITSNGTSLALSNNKIITVESGSGSTANNWDVGDKLIVCPGTVINVSDKYSQIWFVHD
jgi:hypothetical protein